MSMGRRALQGLLVTLTFLAAVVFLLLLAAVTEWTPGEIARPLIPLFLLVLLGVPAWASWWVARALGRRWRIPDGTKVTGRRRALRWLLAAGYGLTSVFGVPAALSQQNAWAVDEYKRLRADGDRRVWETHPYIQTYGAIPVTPGLVLSYHEYQLAGLHGFGGFELTVWYGAGVRSLGSFPLWLS